VLVKEAGMADIRGNDTEPRAVSTYADPSDRSVAELMKQLTEQMSTLVRQEMDLAKAELTEKGKRAGVGAGMFGGAGVFGVFALGALTACVILALVKAAVVGWLAALIVAVAYAAIAGVLALVGKRNVQQGVPPMPEQTIESVKQDVDVAKTRAKEGRA
jgi:uncharacterized membrane protein YqjE